MRKLTAVILIFAMILSLSGCKKTKVKMLVKEYRSGFGITGQDFSGYREYEVKNIKEGDVIVGGFLGSEFKIGSSGNHQARNSDENLRNTYVARIFRSYG